MSNRGRWLEHPIADRLGVMEDGDPQAMEWVFVQGSFSWGLAITWHVLNIAGGYWWVGHVWAYDPGQDDEPEEWDVHEMQHIQIHPQRVEPWMVHPGDRVFSLDGVLNNMGA